MFKSHLGLADIQYTCQFTWQSSLFYSIVQAVIVLNNENDCDHHNRAQSHGLNKLCGLFLDLPGHSYGHF